MSIRYTLAVGTICCVAAVARIAFSEEDEKAEAKMHFEAGTRLYAVEDYQGAVTEFEIAVKLYPTKNSYFNLANCYQALHRYHDALDAVRTLEAEFDDKLDKTMRRKMDELKSLIESVTGNLTVFVEPKGARISLNGKPLPPNRIGTPITVGPGEYRIEASLDNYQSTLKQVKVQSQKNEIVRLKLSPLTGSLIVETDIEGATVTIDGTTRTVTPADPIPLVPGEHRVEISVNGVVAESRTVQIKAASTTTLDIELKNVNSASSSQESSTSKRSIFFPLKVAGISATAATAVLTGVFYGLAAANASDFQQYNDAYSSKDTTDAEAVVLNEKRLDSKSKAEGFSTAGLASAISAGVFGVATLVVAIVGKKSKQKTESTPVSIRDGLMTLSF
jgi:hypothetical protein